MTDTVSGTIIGSSLDIGSPTFLMSDLSPADPSDALHVNGAAHAEQGPLGLLVEFRTLSPDLQAVPSGPSPKPAATVPGYAAALSDSTPPQIVAGALQTG